jgi:hypothetical protein
MISLALNSNNFWIVLSKTAISCSMVPHINR